MTVYRLVGGSEVFMEKKWCVFAFHGIGSRAGSEKNPHFPPLSSPYVLFSPKPSVLEIDLLILPALRN